MLKSELPVITVIMPNYNYGHWILESIDSVYIQDYPAKQLMIIDDGSTDHSYDKVCDVLGDKSDIPHPGLPGRMVQGRYKNTLRVAMIGLPTPTGPSHARNVGIQAAWKYSHLFAMLDSDDVWYTQRLSKIVIKFIEDPEKMGAVYTDYDTQNLITGTFIREFKEPFSRRRLVQQNIVHSGSVVSRLAFEAVGFYDTDLRVAEDYDLWLRISEHFLIYHIPESLMMVRASNQNSTATVSKDKWQADLERVFEKAKARNAQA